MEGLNIDESNTTLAHDRATQAAIFSIAIIQAKKSS
jgi:hypothetical protein